MFEKVNFQTVIFAIIFMAMNGHTSKLFKNIFYDVQFARSNSAQAYSTDKLNHIVRKIYFTFFDGKTQLGKNLTF